jgi:hypothetical protein
LCLFVCLCVCVSIHLRKLQIKITEAIVRKNHVYSVYIFVAACTKKNVSHFLCVFVRLYVFRRKHLCVSGQACRESLPTGNLVGTPGSSVPSGQCS